MATNLAVARTSLTNMDALIVVPPPSPSNTNPPLGPALLVAELEEYGFDAAVLDLNIELISQQASAERPRGRDAVTGPQTLGDHGKDRPLLASAARVLFESFGFEDGDELHRPRGADAIAGMHVSLDALRRRVGEYVRASSGPAPWMFERLSRAAPTPPRVLGVSVMGPSQVFCALAIAEWAKQVWPGTLVVFGGSHVSLLRPGTTGDLASVTHVDEFVYGHGERTFRTLVAKATGRAGVVGRAERDGFRYMPRFFPDQLSRYDRNHLALPLQFSRGCAYALCEYCTYPAVEPTLVGLRASEAAETLMALRRRHDVTRFSLKDSLVTSRMFRDLERALRADARNGVEFEWSATTKVSRALIRLARPLADAGLRTVELGVETIHARHQRAIRKLAALGDIEAVIGAFTDAGVVVVVNLMFGMHGETRREAEEQLEWFRTLRRTSPPGTIDCSLNLLEVVRGSPMERDSRIPILGVAPWAFAYEWDAPLWREEFASVLHAEELVDHM